jgi:hypothetical protein
VGNIISRLLSLKMWFKDFWRALLIITTQTHPFLQNTSLNYFGGKKINKKKKKKRSKPCYG